MTPLTAATANAATSGPADLLRMVDLTRCCAVSSLPPPYPKSAAGLPRNHLIITVHAAAMGRKRPLRRGGIHNCGTVEYSRPNSRRTLHGHRSDDASSFVEMAVPYVHTRSYSTTTTFRLSETSLR